MLQFEEDTFPPMILRHAVRICLLRLIANVVIPNNLGNVLAAPCQIYLDSKTPIQPDIFYVAKDNIATRHNVLGDTWYGMPDLAIEIIGSGTAKEIRHDKFELYAKHEVKEYWIVEPVERFVEIYVLDGETFKKHGVYDETQSFTSTVIPQLTINVAEIFPPTTDE